MRLRRIHGDLSLAIPHGFLSVFLSCLLKRVHRLLRVLRLLKFPECANSRWRYHLNKEDNASGYFACYQSLRSTLLPHHSPYMTDRNNVNGTITIFFTQNTKTETWLPCTSFHFLFKKYNAV